MAQTFGAIAFGLSQYETIQCAGVIANRVNTAGHAAFLQESLRDGPHWIGHLPVNDALALPERHLGLVTASEIADLEQKLDACAQWIAAAKLDLPTQAWAAPATPPPFPPSNRLQGVRIAIAWDNAFCFLYHGNLRWLESAGATLQFFSPLADHCLPEADALYLPGGYPELQLDSLADNTGLIEQIRAHFLADKPILAECGGLLYLLESLQDATGHRRKMAGLVPGDGVMHPRLFGIGMQGLALPGGELRGHGFHYGEWQNGPQAQQLTTPARKISKPEVVHRERRLTASFTHWYFPSAPSSAAQLFLP